MQKKRGRGSWRRRALHRGDRKINEIEEAWEKRIARLKQKIEKERRFWVCSKFRTRNFSKVTRTKRSKKADESPLKSVKA